MTMVTDSQCQAPPNELLEYRQLFKNIWYALYEGLRIVAPRKIEGHMYLAKQSLEIIDKLEPCEVNQDDVEGFETWAMSLDLAKSFITDELVECLTLFLPYDDATFCARVRRNRLLRERGIPLTPAEPPSHIPTIQLAVASSSSDSPDAESSVALVPPTRSVTRSIFADNDDMYSY